MLSTEAQQSLPHDAQVALQQVDNRTSCHCFDELVNSRTLVDTIQ
jgi:hypothetical protein